jgi:hypothetical protein
LNPEERELLDFLYRIGCDEKQALVGVYIKASEGGEFEMDDIETESEEETNDNEGDQE